MQKNLILKLIVITLQCLGQTIPFDESQYIVKDVKYDYDLISGKVNQVTYQGGESDQLQHRYEYDGDNRITAVYTSTDGITWTKEAQYEYYAHGPLAKAELGEQKVETQNYAYTLQGWIKGVKGQNFSYALGYNDTDYKPIVNSSQSTVLSTPIAQQTVNGQLTTDNLYNGNISTWASLNPKINGTTAWTQQFTYDQLNRIKSGSTLNGGDNYKNTYSYDANGNLQTLERWSKTGAKMDEFVYNYEDKKSGYLANTNKLRSVDDKPDFNTLSTEDLDDQEVDNYQYDDIGNLNKDTQEEIEKIEWTVYGKVKAVNRKSDPVTKLPLGNKPNLVFEYDASGNRVSKIATAKDGKVTKTFYIRDASGNVMSTYETTNTANVNLTEQYLYGSSRLGVLDRKGRSYELTDHLGNVRAVVDESKSVTSATDYYPFGMTANAYTPNGYRYGFNGQEKETDLNSSITSAEYWMYDGRLGRRWNIDPMYKQNWSPYTTFIDNPIYWKDPYGNTEYRTNDGKKVVYDDGVDNGVSYKLNKDFDQNKSYEKGSLKEGSKEHNELVANSIKSELGQQVIADYKSTTNGTGKGTKSPGGDCSEVSRERMEKAIMKVMDGKYKTFNDFLKAKGLSKRKWRSSYNNKNVYFWIDDNKCKTQKEIDEHNNSNDVLSSNPNARGAGSAAALQYLGLGDIMTNSECWDGGLRPGDALQVWEHKEAYDAVNNQAQCAEGVGHSLIFLGYTYDSNGNITGMNTYDQGTLNDGTKGYGMIAKDGTANKYWWKWKFILGGAIKK